MAWNLIFYASSADHEASLEPSKANYTDIFRITPAEPWAINTGSWFLFSSEPNLRFQINQASSWKGGSIFPIYNIWSPAYFGISLPQPESTSYKLSCNDIIVTSYEDDIASLKTGDTASIPFEIANVVGGINVNYPGFLCGKGCSLSRGWITLANRERWRFDEIGKLYYQFQRVDEQVHDREFLKGYRNTLLWERYSDLESKYGKGLADLPFTIDQDTRLCRLNVNRHQKRHWDPDNVIAIMNQEGIIFVDGLKEATEIETEIETANIRELILMTGLAIAKCEHSGFEN